MNEMRSLEQSPLPAGLFFHPRSSEEFAGGEGGRWMRMDDKWEELVTMEDEDKRENADEVEESGGGAGGEGDTSSQQQQ